MIVLTIGAVCAGCQPRLPFGEAVHVGSTKAPVIGLAFVPAEFLALQPRLEELYGGRVLFDPALGADDIAMHLEQGDWQFAILSATEYLSIAGKPGIQPVAMAMGEHGQSTIKGLIVAKRDGAVKMAADCKGHRFAFGPHRDLLYDHAALAALGGMGVAKGDLLPELLPPHVVTGRLNLSGGGEVARVVAFDPTVPAGVIDEIAFAALPETGGNVIAGPSKDQFSIIGGTQAVPGTIVVASARADAAAVEKMRSFLTLNVRNSPEICKQMKVKGFVDPDMGAYTAAALLIRE